MNKALESTADILGDVGNAFSYLGNSAGNALGAIFNSLQAVTNAISEFRTIQDAASKATIANKLAEASAEASEAIAGGTASAAKLPFPYNIAAIAAVIGAIVAALSNMSKFATGGIVGGSSFSGDHKVVRVNSGEMILNRSQQANLFKMINEGTTKGNDLGNVQFRIQGKDLVGVFANYNNKMSKLR